MTTDELQAILNGDAGKHIENIKIDNLLKNHY